MDESDLAIAAARLAWKALAEAGYLAATTELTDALVEPFGRGWIVILADGNGRANVWLTSEIPDDLPPEALMFLTCVLDESRADISRAPTQAFPIRQVQAAAEDGLPLGPWDGPNATPPVDGT